MADVNEFQQYAEIALENHKNIDSEKRYALVNSLSEKSIERVLDVGCGAGYDLLPFIEKKNARGFGVDIDKNVGEVGKRFFESTPYSDNVSFICARGELLPFADESFDVVLCMVALPYMNNSKTLAEISRVLRCQGVFFLQIHAPAFFFRMIRERFFAREFKSLIYPIIALFAGSWYWLTGNQLEGGVLFGKEMFQTEKLIKRELRSLGLEISGYLPSNNSETPAFLIIKR
jgi:ubiquinone/menaquinone biosynthesis C-methylase UbiE